MNDINVQALDPGIREIVVKLREAGFETTDSGDGASKPAPGIVIPFPHVVIVTPFPHVVIKSSPPNLNDDADRVYSFLAKENLMNFGNFGKVEATYDPADHSAVILVMWAPDYE